MLTGPTEGPLAVGASGRRHSSGPGTRSVVVVAGPLGRVLAAPRASPPRTHGETTPGTTSANGGIPAPTRRSRSPDHPCGESEPGERGSGVGLHPPRLGGELLRACRREPVVATQPALHHLFPVHLDAPVNAQPVQGRVQRPGPQPHPPVRDRCDIGDDPVAVLAASSQRRKDQEGRLLHRPPRHTTTIYRPTVYPPDPRRACRTGSTMHPGPLRADLPRHLARRGAARRPELAASRVSGPQLAPVVEGLDGLLSLASPEPASRRRLRLTTRL